MKTWNSKGFTLVELMVVVAIIGVLSAVAIPNFRKYQAKSKTTEAKLNLAAIFTNELAFQADYDVFATCLETMGYQPPANGYYALGFAGAAPTEDAAAQSAGATGCVGKPTGYDGARSAGGGTPAVFSALDKTATTATAFTAQGMGIISPESAFNTQTTGSSWTIDETKFLNQVNPGY
jgi:type IV pilus assembly protein PilA